MKPKTLYLIIAISFFIKILLVLLLKEGRNPESFEYETIANNILSGEGFIYYFFGVAQRAFLQPLYPVLSAVVYYLTNHSHMAMLIIQSLVSSLIPLAVYFIAIRLASHRQALLAALLVAFHPGLVVYSVFKLHSLVLDTFLYLLFIVAVLKFIENPGVKNAFLAGIIAGFSLLSRITILPFSGICLVFMYIFPRGIEKVKRIKYILIICAFALLVYSPWIIRNYKVMHKFVFMQTCAGENLWVGNNPLSSGSAITETGESIHGRMPIEMRQTLNRLDELQQVRYYNEYFLKFIKEQPRAFVKLFLKKLFYFWWFSPHTGLLYKKLWLQIYKIYYGLAALLAVVGLFCLLFKYKSNYLYTLILLIYMFSISLIHAVVNIDTRHRWTVEPIMIIFSSIGLFNLAIYFKTKLTKLTSGNLRSHG